MDPHPAVSRECRHWCRSLGSSRVRSLLASHAPIIVPRQREAEAWLDERLSREGVWLLRGLVAAIVLSLVAIVAVVALLW